MEKDDIHEFVLNLLIPVLLSLLVLIVVFKVDKIYGFYSCAKVFADCLVPTLGASSISIIAKYYKESFEKPKYIIFVLSSIFFIVFYFIYRNDYTDLILLIFYVASFGLQLFLIVMQFDLKKQKKTPSISN